jgi:hypothetical protein
VQARKVFGDGGRGISGDPATGRIGLEIEENSQESMEAGEVAVRVAVKCFAVITEVGRKSKSMGTFRG